MNKQKILEVLTAAGHGAHAALVESLIRPAILITGEKLADRPRVLSGEEAEPEEEDEEGDAEAPATVAKVASIDLALEMLPLGASRFGGLPDLPPGVAWPVRDDVPMEFVAQIRLADAAPYDVLHQLPASGSLLFFYNSQWTTYDQDQDLAACAVLYHPGADSELIRTAPPRVDYQGEYDPTPRLAPYIHGLARLTFSGFEMPPGGVSPWTSAPPLAEFWQDFDAYHEVAYSPTPHDGSYRAHHLLGYVGAQDYVDAHLHGTEDQLLLQIDSDGCADFQWGDCDRLYFLLSKAQLAARDFASVRLYSQLG